MVAADAQDDALYPAVEPYASGQLLASGGHRIYFEQCGRRDGAPVLFLHGGPGSQSRPQHRRYFDPAFYRIVLFDQRGCGKSSPLGETADNTTAHLVADIERLRRELRIERWILFAGSWGAALAIAYAATYPQSVAGLVLRGVFLASRAEVDWYVHGLNAFVPEQVSRLRAGACGDVLQRYHGEINHPDPIVAMAAAQRWIDYEDRVMGIGASSGAGGSAPSGPNVLARARVQLHYLVNGCFLRDQELLDNAWRVAAPAIIVQGRRDMVCPPVTAYWLSQRLPRCELRIVEQGGHSGTEPVMAAALRAAADDMRALAVLP